MTRRRRLFRSLVMLGIMATLGLVVACSPATSTDGATPTTSVAEPEATSTPSTPESGEAPLVEPDPDVQEKLIGAFFSTRGWKTNFSLHTVPFDGIISGGPPRDGIPPIDAPTYATINEADQWLDPQEPVIFLEVNGEARAYPIQIMVWHEIANDQLGGVPVAVTFCPLCNSAIVFDRELDGVVYDFGTSGNLRNSDLVMWDRITESWWQQFTGEAIVGDMAGRKLRFIATALISWEDFKTANPNGSVLDRPTGFGRPYGLNPYAGYDELDNPPFLYSGELDGRLLPKERVVALELGGVAVAFPFSVLRKEGAVNYTVNGRDVAILFDGDTESAFANQSTNDYEAVGASGVFDAHLDGQKLTFRAEGDGFVDEETGSVWDILGKATEGALAGKALTPIVHANHFWFAFGAFRPDTIIYQGVDKATGVQGGGGT